MAASSVFVGRERELAVVRAALARAVAGEGSFVALVGEPGIGKTRLAAELTRDAQAHGARAVWGRCHAGDVAPAFWPWVQVLRSYDQASPSREVEALASALRDARQAGAKPPPMTAPSGLVRFELFERVVTLLRGIARRQPLLLLFDDLHWADRSSLLLLEFAARELCDAAVLFVGTYREAELAPSPDVAELLGNLMRLGTTLQVRGLDRADMAALVQQSFSGTLSEAVVAAVHEATEGNPFFALEVISLLSVDEVLAAHTVRRAAALPIPAGVRETIRRRLAPLPAPSQQALRAAAVLGREFDLTPLAAMLAMPVDRLLEVLTPVFAASLVRPAPESIRRYAFAHALVREQLYDEIPIPERVQWHRRAAEAIETIGTGALEEHVAELAHHYFEAARSGDPEKAIRYGRRAGLRALALFAYDEAVRAFERALALADLASPSSDVRVELLLGLGDARHGGGDREGAEAACRDAVELARACGPALLAEAVAHYVEVHREAIAVDERLLALLEEALAELPPGELRLHALLRTQLAAARWLRPGAEQQQRRLADEAVDIARRLGQVPTLIYVLVHRLGALLGPDTLAERLASENEVFQLAERLGRRSAAVGAWTLHIHSIVEIGDRSALSQAVHECEQHMATQGHPFYRWQASSVCTMVALLEGRWAEAETLANETLAVGQTVQGQAALAFVAQLLKLRAETGRGAEVAALVETAAARAQMPAMRSVLADLYAVLGRTDDARRELEGLAADGFRGVPRDGAWLMAICLAANACVQLADRRHAGVLYAMLHPYRDRIAAVPPAIVALSPVAHHLGQLATVLDRFDDAAVHFDQALAIAEQMQGTPWVAHTEQAYAELLVARGTVGDRRRALQRLARAQRIGEELGMVLVLARVATTRARVEALPPDDEPAAEVPVEAAELVETSAAVGDTAPGIRERAVPGQRARVVQLAPRPAGSDQDRGSFHRAGDLWTITRAGRTIRLRHAVGLAHLALLLEHPRQPVHVNDLLAHARPATGGLHTAVADLTVRADLGDAGTILDPAAKAAYRQRLAELREELEQATACNDTGRSGRAQAELEFVRDELERSMGLGGRDRRAAAAAERGRVAVAKAIKHALRKIAEQDESIADHLQRAVRTGYFCSYEPAAGDSPVWDV